MSNTISNSDDVIDSRDVITRLEELRDARQSIVDARDDADATLDDKELAIKTLAEWGDDNGAEFNSLMDLDSNGDGYSGDWKYGATLIRDSYFEDYARQLCEDIGDVPKNLPHYIEIDWAATARNIRMDYTSVSFDGVDYWVR
jgi:hypothetical protein